MTRTIAGFKSVAKNPSKLSLSLVLLISIFVCFYFNNVKYSLKFSNKISTHNMGPAANITSMKYLLLWTDSRTTPFEYFGKGNKMFLNKGCKWSNCYVTADRDFLGDYSEFDVVAFDGTKLMHMIAYGDFPVRRTIYQKYVFAGIEASANYPLCSTSWNGFFNWTWTYKLNSDAVWGYFAVRNASKHIIGPSEIMNWKKLDEMDDIDEELKKKLSSKTQTAAWFVSNCMTQSFRENYVQDLQKHLKKFNMGVNIFGKCGTYDCPREVMPRCLKKLEKNYYFYLAFENAISDDYVTERIVYALNHNTVPIVFGGANYSRFMPDSSYLNAYKMKPADLAAKMYKIIKNPSMYQNFFRWKKYYSYHLRNGSPDTDDYCNFCAKMNDDQLMKTSTIYEDLNKWWTGPDMDNVCYPTINPNNDPLLLSN